MKSATRQTIEAILRADDSVAPEELAEVIEMLGGRWSGKRLAPILLTQQQASDLLGVSRFTIRRMSLSGKLHPVRLRDRWRYLRSEIEDIATSQTPAEGPQSKGKNVLRD